MNIIRKKKKIGACARGYQHPSHPAGTGFIKNVNFKMMPQTTHTRQARASSLPSLLPGRPWNTDVMIRQP